MQISFTALGKPQGKARPRFCRRYGKTFTFTPKKTVQYERNVRTSYKSIIRHKFEPKVPLQAEITAFYKIPQSASKKAKKKMLNGELLPTIKPDADNVIKIIFDALNRVCYHDDSQICKIIFEKKFSENPRVTVKIAEIDTRGGSNYEEGLRNLALRIVRKNRKTDESI